jgi:hypothetical protein
MWQKQLKDENNETTAKNSEANSTAGEPSDAKQAANVEIVLHKPDENNAEVVPGKTFLQAASEATDEAAPVVKEDPKSSEEHESPNTPDNAPESPNEAPDSNSDDGDAKESAGGAELNVTDTTASPAGQASKAKKKKKKKSKKN